MTDHRARTGQETARREFVTALQAAIQRSERRAGRSHDRQALARRLAMAKSTLYAYLNGTTIPSTTTLDALLDAFGIDPAEVGRIATLRDAAELARRTGRSNRKPPTTADVTATTGSVVPRQLPRVTPRVVGRDAEFGRLDTVVREAGTLEPALMIIDGTAGVGKTTLAVTWAARVAPDFPDGQLFIDLRGFDAGAPLSAGHALHQVLESLGVAASTIPSDTAAKAALYRSLLADKRLLVVLDNARSADHARPLIPTGAHVTLVTSRHRLGGLILHEGAQRITVDLLGTVAAEELLRLRMGLEPTATGLTTTTDALVHLADLCAGLPLALSIVAAQTTSASEIADRVEELRAEHTRLDLLGVEVEDLDLRAVFSWSVRALPEAAARLFRLLAAYPGTTWDRAASAALAGSDEDSRPLLRSLVEANLLTEDAGRYTAHDLLRAYAADLARSAPEEHHAATARLLDHYLGTAARANSLLQPCRVGELPPVEISSAPLPMSTYAEAMGWFTAELPALLRVIEDAAASFPERVWRLAAMCTVFLRRTGRRVERERVHLHGLAAALHCGDRLAHADALRLLGDARARLGNHDSAVELLTESLSECAELGSPAGIRHAHLSLCRIHESRGNHARALQHAETALAGADPSEDRLGYADCLDATARLNLALGEHRTAISLGGRALTHYEQLGYEEGVADILVTLGRAESLLGHHDTAIDLISRSLAIDRALGDRFWEAHAMDRLGDVHHAAGDLAAALAHWRGAAAVFELLRHPARARLDAKIDLYRAAPPQSSGPP
ncbi:ATP-binding protein [Nocardia sp. NPDC055053]